jgi:hypothetical protein
MRLFQLHRDQDASGVSGTGVVAEGVEFTNGECALHWLSDNPCINIYPSLECVKKIHGHGGMTRVVWVEAKKRRSVTKSAKHVIGAH